MTKRPCGRFPTTWATSGSPSLPRAISGDGVREFLKSVWKAARVAKIRTFLLARGSSILTGKNISNYKINSDFGIFNGILLYVILSLLTIRI